MESAKISKEASKMSGYPSFTFKKAYKFMLIQEFFTPILGLEYCQASNLELDKVG